MKPTDVYLSEPINGVTGLSLTPHQDSRGCLTEISRVSWDNRYQVLQWNVMNSLPRVLRGVHVHLKHWDYLVMVQGRMQLGLCDLRRDSSTFLRSAVIGLDASHPVGWCIPPGVAHGFYFPVDSVLVYGVSDYWSMDDELGCRWDDPGLGLDWQISQPLLSARDSAALALRELMPALDAFDFTSDSERGN